MAELLVFTKDNPGLGYKRGDVVTAQEDGWVWGSKETLPKFFVLKLPGVPVAKVMPYVQPEYILQNFELGKIKRRLWGFLVDNVPQAVRDEIVSTGEYTTTVAQIKAFIKNKVTGEEADFNG